MPENRNECPQVACVLQEHFLDRAGAATSFAATDDQRQPTLEQQHRQARAHHRPQRQQDDSEVSTQRSQQREPRAPGGKVTARIRMQDMMLPDTTPKLSIVITGALASLLFPSSTSFSSFPSFQVTNVETTPMSGRQATRGRPYSKAGRVSLMGEHLSSPVARLTRESRASTHNRRPGSWALVLHSVWVDEQCWLNSHGGLLFTDNLATMINYNLPLAMPCILRAATS